MGCAGGEPYVRGGEAALVAGEGAGNKTAPRVHHGPPYQGPLGQAGYPLAAALSPHGKAWLDTLHSTSPRTGVPWLEMT